MKKCIFFTLISNTIKNKRKEAVSDRKFFIKGGKIKKIKEFKSKKNVRGIL